MFTVICTFINFISFHFTLASCPFRPQEASPRLPARLPAAGNAAVRVALPAQKGKEGENREGEERQGANAEEEQSQEDEVQKLTPGGGINRNQILQMHE